MCVVGSYKTVIGSNECVNCTADMYSTEVVKTDTVCLSCVVSSQSLTDSDELTDWKYNTGFSGADGGTVHGVRNGSIQVVDW